MLKIKKYFLIKKKLLKNILHHKHVQLKIAVGVGWLG
jgi:hypothetical protein